MHVCSRVQPVLCKRDSRKKLVPVIDAYKSATFDMELK